MTALPSVSPRTDEREHFRSTALAILREQGYGSPAIDEDGDIRFRVDGLGFYLLLDDEDPEYVRISLPNFYPIDTADELARADVVAMQCQQHLKFGGYVVPPAPGRSVSASVPLLVPDAAFITSERMFRLTHLLRKMAEEFVEGMNRAATRVH